jgi:O-antigen/teichoic acid export membrane protein
VAVLILVGSRPHATVLALQILGCGLGFSFVGAVTQYALLAMRAHREILVINLLALMLNGVLTVLLARPYGAPGAALALACSEVLVAGVSTFFLCRHIPELRLPLKIIPRLAIVVVLAVAVDLALQSTGAVLTALATPAAVVATGLVSGAIPRELLAALSIPRRRA